jgi:hypothetical protein
MTYLALAAVFGTWMLVMSYSNDQGNERRRLTLLAVVAFVAIALVG